MSKIDVNSLAKETFEKVIKQYEEDLEISSKQQEENDGLGKLLYDQLESLRRHNERFTTLLVQKVVDEIEMKYLSEK